MKAAEMSPFEQHHSSGRGRAMRIPVETGLGFMPGIFGMRELRVLDLPSERSHDSIRFMRKREAQ
jgi:hypothetical protein